MKRIPIPLAILIAMSFWPTLSQAQKDNQKSENYNVELEGRYWNARLDAQVKIVDGHMGTEMNLVDDLGFDKTKGFGEARLQVKWFQRNKFNFSYIPLRWNADKVLTKDVIFVGQIFTAGTRVQSHLDMQFFKGGYEYDFLIGKYGFLGASFDILLSPTDIELKAPSQGIVEQHDLVLPAAMVGIVGRINILSWLGFTAKLSGLPVGEYGHVLDAEATLDVNPIKYIGISGGYRIFEVKAKFDDNSVFYHLDGPFLALKIRF